MHNLKAGFARRDITQPLGSPALYGPTAVVGEIWDPLYATAAYLEDGQQRAVVVGADVCEILEQAQSDICAAVGKAVGVPAERVLLNGSHTHSAPYVSTELQELMTPYGLKTLGLDYACHL